MHTEGDNPVKQKHNWFTVERRWVLGFASVVMLLTSIPYVLGYAFQGENWIFSGFVFAVEDGNSYIAKMLSGASGAWLFRTPYTAFPQNGVLAIPFYIWLGKLTAPPGQHEQLVVLYHVFRVTAGILAILATYDFIGIYIKDIKFKRFGLAMVVLGGGLGWILVLLGRGDWLGSLPLEYYSPESFGFLALYGLPHLSLARATMLWGLRVYLLAIGKQDQNILKPGLLCGGFWLLTSLAQPISAIVMGVVIGLFLGVTAAWQLVRQLRAYHTDWPTWRQSVKFTIIAGILPAPYLLYNALAFSMDPFLKIWTGQNLILSPHPAHYLLAYGWLLILAIPAVVGFLRRYPWKGWLPVIWLFAFPILAYAPVNIQRRLVEGVWVAIVILAVVFLERILADKHTKYYRVTQLALIPIFISTLVLFTGGILAVSTLATPIYRNASEVEAFQELENQSQPEDVVLASYDTGNAIPAWVPIRVVIGHGPESANLADVQPRVKAFFSSETSDTTRKNILYDFNVTYIFWGPEEQALGDWQPQNASYLSRVYAKDGYEIFFVNLPSL